MRSHILALSNILPPPANSDVAALADSDRPARALLRHPPPTPRCPRRSGRGAAPTMPAAAAGARLLRRLPASSVAIERGRRRREKGEGRSEE
jgi:hypothetical protein